MKVGGFDYTSDNVTIDIIGENDGEKALLTHFQQGHVSILCPGDLGRTGVRVFIRNKARFEFEKEALDEAGRKGQLERRRNRKSKIRNRK